MNSPAKTPHESLATLAGIKRLSRRFTGFFLLAAALLLAALVVVTGPTAEPRDQVERAWPVTVIPAQPQALAPVLLNFGRVEAQQTAKLNSTISARVSRVLVREGDRVNAGDLLLELDDTEIQFVANSALARLKRSEAALSSLQAEYALAREITDANQSLAEVAAATLARARDLHTKKMIADAQLDTAIREASQGKIALARHLSELNAFPDRIEGQRAAVAEARAEAERAQFDLAQTRVLAPFDGRVLASPFAVGERVPAGTSLVALADYTSLEIRTTLPAKAARRLEQNFNGGGVVKKKKTETPVTASASVDGATHSFELARIGGAVRTGQGGLDAFFAVPPNSGLEIGAVVDLAIELPTQDRVFVMPLYSLYEDSIVYRVREQRLEALRYDRVGDYLDASGEFLALVRIDEAQPGDSLLGSQLSRAITGLLVTPITGSTVSL